VTLEDVGIIGELVAALATVVTLGYLAIQIRANSRLMRAEARRAAKTHSSQANLTIANDAQLAGVLRRGLSSYEALEPDEQFQFMFFLSDYISQADSAFAERRLGFDGGEDFDMTWGGVRFLLCTPGGRTIWQFHRNRLGSAEFRAFVDSELQESEESGDHQ
jgi:hypothetical protein